MLNRALLAIRRGSGLEITLLQARRSAPLRIALKIAFMLFFTGNAEMLGILLQLQADRLIERMQTKSGMGTVQPA